ncbi:MAG: OmpA family protein [Armatimonadetes bacterium]|nr:OmpA family protein [Armatimonadota bacterium]
MANDAIIIKKKKVAGHGGHHGGSWKVAYADFVTAMMAFFMVLWIMGLSDETKASIQGYFNDPAGFMKNPPVSRVVIPRPGKSFASPKQQRASGSGTGQYEGTSPTEEEESKAVANEVKQKLYGLPDIDHVIITETSEGIQIEFLEDVTSVFFESGSSIISPLGTKIIKKITPIVKDTGRFIVLEGHTDRKPYAGKDYTNWELSSDRANAFRKALNADGIPTNRFKEVRALADTKLKFPGNPFAAGNRRVTLLLPWGKLAAKANVHKLRNESIRSSIGFGGDKPFNIMAPTVHEPHL